MDLVGLAWPAAALGAMWIFREPLRALIPRFRKVEMGPGGLKLDIGSLERSLDTASASNVCPS